MALRILKMPDVKNSSAVKRADKLALDLFHNAASRVPAYKHFLAKEGINPQKIKSIGDLSKVTPVDKKNYLTQYSLNELSWDGNLFNSRIISVSSGSTGSSFFWPRGLTQDLEGTWMHEQLLNHMYDIENQSTLVVVCFSMGTWIAGAFTTSSVLGLADRGYRINIVTPGIERDEAVKVIRNLAPNYDQIILCGYPPFLKDVIDQAKQEGVKWREINAKFLFAGEAFSEEWRSHVLSMAAVKNPYVAANVYGTADAAMLGHETPVSIAARRLYNRRPRLRQEVFNTPILPSLVQYYPDRRYFEAVDGELVFTANAGLPLIRYNIHDTGGILSYKEVITPVEPYFSQEIRERNIKTKPWQLPFIYLNGRKDFTVTIYAVNIYPENIKSALIDPKMRSWVTGKFTMMTKYHKDMDQYFEINIELARGIKADAQYMQLAKDTVISKLRRLNAEYHKLYTAVGIKAEPTINLLPYGDKKHFGNGVKHKWVNGG
jgi:phenylacetate-CoA ligase